MWIASFLAVAFVIIVILRYSLDLTWTGLGSSKLNGKKLPAKTLWDWLDLLIVPVVLAIGGYLFNSSQSRATEAAADRRSQDEALQAYLEELGKLLLDENRPLRPSKRTAEERSVARARTLTVLGRLEGGRKRSVLQFLYEAGLITSDRAVIDLSGADISGAALNGASLRYANLRQANLSHADLNGAFLSHANLSHTDLSGTHLSGANLFGADLSLANLNEADLSDANLMEAILSGGNNLRNANLSKADLSKANLYGADLSLANLNEADLSDANLMKVHLNDADLSDANLTNVSLKGADLSGAKLSMTNGKLDYQAASLKGATMPNGQKYEDWLKDREGRKEDAEKE